MCDVLQIPDFLTLDQLLEKKRSVLVVGGGFLGTELAVGMAARCEQGRTWQVLFVHVVVCHLIDKSEGLKVHQLFPEAGNLGLVLPPALAAWTLGKVKKGQCSHTEAMSWGV